MGFELGPEEGFGMESGLVFGSNNDIFKPIRDFIGKDYLIERGLYYYQQGRVRILSEREGSVEATVKGSTQKPYRVYLHFDKKGAPRFALCTCPYFPMESTCKHIAAVLFQYFGGNPGGIEDILHYQKQAKTESTVIEVENLKTNSNTLNPFQYLTTDPFPIDKQLPGKKGGSRKDTRRKKHQLVFLIKRSSEYFGESPWMISAGARYIKQNGEGGKIYNYDASKITEPFGLEEKVLLNRLIMMDKQRDLFHKHIDYLVSHKLTNIFIELSSGPVQVGYRKLEKLNVRFALSSFEGKDFQFVPLLYLFGKNENPAETTEKESQSPLDEHHNFSEKTENKIILHHSEDESPPSRPMEMFLDGLSVYFLSTDGKLFYSKNDEILYRLMLLLYQEKESFTPAEINQIKQALAQNTTGVNVEFNARKIKLTRTLPRPILELEDHYSSVVVNILFDYQGKEVGFKLPADFVLNEISGEEYSITLRNYQYESSVNRYLHSLLRSSIRYSYSDTLLIENNLVDFLLDYGKTLIEMGMEIRLKSNKKKISSTTGKVGLSVSSGIDWFDLEAVHIDPDGVESRVQLDPNMISRGLLRIGDSYTIISEAEVKKLQTLMEEGMNRKGRLRVSRYNVSIIDRFYEDIQNHRDPRVKTAREIAQKLNNFTRIEHYQIPHRFRAKLREYQYAGYCWLCFLNSCGLGGCLADDMGLGKTVQALALMQKLKENNCLAPSLIVVPVTTLSNWESEINRFTSGIDCRVHHGPARNCDEDALNSRDITVTSYHTLRSDIEVFRNINFRCVILDESQYIKNSRSQIFKAVKLLQAEHRVSLTGTPIENNTFELWSQMDFLNPGLLGNISEFKKNFAKHIESDNNEKQLQKLKQMVYPFILRRKKEEVAKELPQKSEIILYSEMEKAQRSLYSELTSYYREKVSRKIKKDGIERSAVEILSALLRLRQAALFPGLVGEKYGKIKSCKFEQLKETVNEILDEDHKVLIFSQFVESLKIINAYFKNKVGISYIDGSVSAAKRKKQIARFNSDDRVKLFLLSLKAGGTGINLTAADYVILYDPWWNPAVESQAVDRTHRIGQNKRVIAYRMIVRDTIEEKILKLQAKKKKLVNDLVAEDAGLFKSLRKEDIMVLF
ncbi:MAG: SNF2-related protein [Spirochaetota bacterium]